VGEEWERVGNGRRVEGRKGREGEEGIGPQVTVEPGPLKALLRHCLPGHSLLTALVWGPLINHMRPSRDSGISCCT